MSDPTDLIRAVDRVHVAGYGHPPNGGPAEKFCKRCQSAWPCEMRRLRDAYEQSQAELADVWRTDIPSLRDALAEANATIERVRALADTYGFTPNMTSVHHEIADQITCAIEGPAT